ncbi:acyl-CoA dehydrogenase family protein [Nocardia sp. CDC159]|uniref:Acyl-CoA dehydrogenase family protein n=1 Tax=Nocardia pulmonis TaxID=2951408 RepID=A0A9X2E9I9_9NOCA|nr:MULTISPECIES: acyl-CoA dehydrogenase family protein [Nocardia]MCM6774301.1 acyl-CoA dehydrogenase family protein [Nocardia pulmonis]MCM6787633.1 acyl-CoA dehydrogenase family protein [Nocardia sp. CDC159]
MSEFRQFVRDALAEIVLPHADRWEDQGFIDRAAWQALGARGLLGIGLSGPEFLRSAVLLEELGRTGYAGVRAAIAVHAYMAASYLSLFGTPDQRHRYGEQLRQGRLVVALAISEPESGSDLRELATRADPAAEGYRLTGTKSPVANGLNADLLITLARTGTGELSNALAGTSLFIVRADEETMTRSPLPMLGWHSAGIAAIDLRGVAVADDDLLGRKDRALLHIMRALDFERLVAALLALGGARHCLELLDGHARARVIKGAPLASHQVIRHRLAELAGELELVRGYVYEAARLHSLGRLDTFTASTAKLRATELAARAARVCLQYHGARGYERNSVPARVFRDAAGATIAAGATEVMYDLMAESARFAG